MDRCYVGLFMVRSQSIIVADTQCNLKKSLVEKTAGQIFNPLPGEWSVYTDCFCDNIYNMIVCSSDIDVNDLNDKEWRKESFLLKSQSGQIGIFNESNFQKDTDVVDLLDKDIDYLLDMPTNDMWHSACLRVTKLTETTCVEYGVLYHPEKSIDFCANDYSCYSYYKNDMCIAIKIVFLINDTFYCSSEDSIDVLSDSEQESDDTYYELAEDDDE